MKQIISLQMFVATALLLGHCADLRAAQFNSGSTGAYGPMNISTDTVLDLPADGKFHCTTINVDAGATLSFNRNPLNTPVYLLATSNIVVSGVIDVSGGDNIGGAPGRGGPGGFDGGFGGFGVGANTSGGDGQGPGGGKNTGVPPFLNFVAAFAVDNSGSGRTYGNALLVPLIGGSGGAGVDGNPGTGGNGGGGAILLAGNGEIQVNGKIDAHGGGKFLPSSGYGPGSGGAIRLVAPTVFGNGILEVSGGVGYPYHTVASGGRIRIDCIDRYAFRSLTMNGQATRGSQMFVAALVTARLDIVSAAGQAIAEGTGNSVQIDLPAGSPTNLTCVVQARDFTNNVAIALVVTPENRPSVTYTNTILMTNNPSRLTLNVSIPEGTISRIHAWTR